VTSSALMPDMSGTERRRLADTGQRATDWYLWGPCLSERQWGTVREDYSRMARHGPNLPHDRARSRAYRSGEDELAGFGDHKLLVNFTWWINREDADGSNLFEGGFLGLDNVGPLDRSHLLVAGYLQQADATSRRYRYPRRC
jgi:hypothetical protein